MGHLRPAGCKESACTVPLQRKMGAAQESKFSEAERLTEEAKRAAREAHLRAEEALQKERQAEEAERRSRELRAKHDQEAHQLEALRAKVQAPKMPTCLLSLRRVSLLQPSFNV